MIKTAVIGLGDIAHVHVPLLQSMKDVELVALCDTDTSRKDVFQTNAKFYSDYQEMIEQEELDVVHICLPHYLHFPVTKYCAEHGVHVLQEKPLSLHASQAQESAELEEQVSVKLCICLQNRMNASFKKCMEFIQNETFGKVTGVTGIVAWARPREYYTVKPWRGTWEYAGGGVMINQSIHTLDLMQLIGGEIQSINGNVCNLLDYDIEVEDTATASIQFKNGVKGWFIATNANSDNDSVHIEVHLEHAVLRIQDCKLYLVEEGKEPKEIIEDALLAGPKSYYGAGHRIVFQDFYKAIQENNDDYIHLHEGVISMQIIDAIQASSKNKQIIEL